MRATTAGADGSFRVDVPGRGRATLVVSADGYATTWWWGADPAAPIEIRLSREARLAGRVVSAADGAPVPGLVVRALLTVPAGTDGEKARRLLAKAETSCLIANSLAFTPTLSCEIATAEDEEIVIGQPEKESLESPSWR